MNKVLNALYIAAFIIGALIKALENGEIGPSRYESYLSIYHGNDTRG